MYRITTQYRHQNPVKLVFPIALKGDIKAGTELLLTDTEREAFGTVIRCYRTPRQRHIAWVRWA